jgi:hypothetical protein
MSKRAFTDQVRQAIRDSGLSQYAIWKACGIDKGNMSRFMRGQVGLSLENLDRIADLIGMTATLKSKKVKHGERNL